MKERMKNSVSEIKLHDDSKKRILSDVKLGKTSGRKIVPIRRYVSVAAVFCVLIVSAVMVSVYVNSQNKPELHENIQTVQQTGDPVEESNVLAEGGQKVYVGANIGDSSEKENIVTSALEQSTAEPAQSSENAESSYAFETSESPESKPKTEISHGDVLEVTPEMSYIEMNGLYVYGSLYKKIQEDKTKTLYNIKVFPYDSEDINDFVYKGNRYGDVDKKYSDAEEQFNLLLDIMVYFDENENNNIGESSAAYAADSELASGVLVVSPPYNDAFLDIVNEYKKDGKADTEKINAEKESLEKTITELSELREKMITAYNTQFAEKAKEEFLRCGIKNAEIIYDTCYINVTAAELKQFIPESKETYALYENTEEQDGAEVLE